MKAKSERRRPFIGDQISECRDASGLFYILCFNRGYLVNWDVQVSLSNRMQNKRMQNFILTNFPFTILHLENGLGLHIQ